MNESSLKQLIQSLFPKQDDIIVGKVTKLYPLTVKDVSDDKLEIRPLYGRSISNMISAGTLEVGSEVLMLCYKGGKKYFVLDRV
jgi:hypothetical protein